ncbi:mannosylphosphorylation protein [Ophiostoma piceae UAMH 11346]|uniref:Mannosylphosphorylation protein n=1 Tax=Ophiostoma piceae (strain UAMH 11346) TaxID=1262450 RepID=S3C987_OPHP1|nr:mannosylphosphorylation protein [Ophiostoma piceae UAMH 11346]
MQLGSLVASLCALSSTVLADADFASVRRRLRKDMSGRKTDPAEKYFHIGVETWLMHGSLLGWWWNKQIMPWDSDIDVQVMEPSMYYLAAYYNMSVFHYKTPRIPEGRDYLLEINPHYHNREQTDLLNAIDARWIDTVTGLFIDITTARYNLSHPAGAGMLSCKDGHEYRDTYLLPLHDTKFEGAPVKIPYRFQDMLESEYGIDALTDKDFHDHTFDDDSMEWVPHMNIQAQERLNHGY